MPASGVDCAELLDRVKGALSEQDIQKRYFNLIQKGDISGLRGLYRATGTPLDTLNRGLLWGEIGRTRDNEDCEIWVWYGPAVGRYMELLELYNEIAGSPQQAPESGSELEQEIQRSA